MPSVRSFIENTFFSYSIFKVVKFPNTGVKTIFLLTSFLGVVLVYVIYGLKTGAWFVDDTPLGQIRLQLKQTETAIDVSKHPYCSQAPSGFPKGANKPTILPCVIWDEFDTVYPEELDRSIYVTTRVTERRQERACSSMGDVCFGQSVYNTTDKIYYYIAAVESFSLRIQHNVMASKFSDFEGPDDEPPYTGTDETLEGCLLDGSGEPVKCFGSGQPNDITIGELLKVVNVSLDDPPANDDAEDGDYRQIRYEGFVLAVIIDYSNARLMFGGIEHPINYVYRVKKLPSSQYKIVQVLHTEYPSRRTLRDRHGIMISVIQSGRFVKFDVTKAIFLLLLVWPISGLIAALFDQYFIRKYGAAVVTETHELVPTSNNNNSKKQKSSEGNSSSSSGSGYQEEVVIPSVYQTEVYHGDADDTAEYVKL